MSKEFPSQFGNAPQYRNPSGTIPMAQPKDIPVPSWTQTRYRLDWGVAVAVDPAQGGHFPEGWLWTVNWSSPFFDMRPDLRSSQGQVKEGVPMWRMGARLYVELIGGLNAPGGVSHGATANDWYALFNNEPGRLPVILGALPEQGLMGPLAVVTATFFPATPGAIAALGVFSPPGDSAGGGEGYPVRYWRLNLSFTRFQTGPSTTQPAPNLQESDFLRIEAGVY
jgi:hypothetical protein